MQLFPTRRVLTTSSSMSLPYWRGVLIFLLFQRCGVEFDCTFTCDFLVMTCSCCFFRSAHFSVAGFVLFFLRVYGWYVFVALLFQTYIPYSYMVARRRLLFFFYCLYIMCLLQYSLLHLYYWSLARSKKTVKKSVMVDF